MDVRDLVAVDPEAVQRADRAHAKTQNDLAEVLARNGSPPRSPAPGEPEYDLAWERHGTVFVAEVKSITDQNEEVQLRLGLGQILRYRQLIGVGIPGVVAVLVSETRPTDASWVELGNALGVVFVWPGVFERLLAPPSPPSS